MLRVVSLTGRLLCIASAAAFGAMAIFGKLAFAHGATAATLLCARFTIAAVVLWAILLTRRPRALRTIPRRDIGTALALGACGYALQAGAYFVALEHIEASQLSLVLYTFPAMVAAASAALGRERLDASRVTALALVSTGLVLVLAGAGTGTLEGAGLALGFTAAIVYATYILASAGIAGRLDALVLTTLVCTGAAVSLTTGGALAGQLRPGAVSLTGWGCLAGVALVSTVAAIGLFFAGLQRVGPTTASILSTVEPLVTITLAAIVFGERLTPMQAAGAALVLAAVFVLRGRSEPVAAPVPKAAPV